MKYNFNKLWKKLIDLNMTKNELVEKSGVSRSSLSRMKRGYPIALDCLMRICNVLNCELGDIMDIEEKAIITSEFKDITNNDMHVIEAIGTGVPKNMSTIAKELSVTVGTLTIAMNSLVKKGYVVRERGKEDRRVVYISLSDKGRKAHAHHAKFHQEMIQGIKNTLNEEELNVLIKALTTLDSWFRNKEQENKK